MSERRLTRQWSLQADLDQYSGEIQGEVSQESPNKHRHLGVTVRPKVVMRLIHSTIDVVVGLAELPVQLMLISGLMLSFFQVFQLGIDGAVISHGQCEPHVALLDNFFSVQSPPPCQEPLHGGQHCWTPLSVGINIPHP